jgi:hypothetical protein
MAFEIEFVSHRERNYSICVLDTPKTILCHALFQKEMTLITWLRRENIYRRNAPDT